MSLPRFYFQENYSQDNLEKYIKTLTLLAVFLNWKVKTSPAYIPADVHGSSKVSGRKPRIMRLSAFEITYRRLSHAVEALFP